jgi:hypothetical protein
VKEGLDFKPLQIEGDFAFPGLAGLAGAPENRYIRRNLWFSYDRVLRVGPFRTRSFLLPERV